MTGVRDTTLVDDLARRLTAAKAERVALSSLRAEHPDLDLPTAYRIQRVLRDASGRLAGWKLGLTSRAKQVQVGVDSPLRGFLAARDALDIGVPLRVGDHIAPRCEPEVVFTMGRELAGPHVTAADVLAAVASVTVGIEVLDSRYLNYAFTMPDVVADNTSAGRFLIGEPVALVGIDLRKVGVVLEHNGEVVATASGAAALGHPAAAVAWLVRSLHAEGEGVSSGEIVLSGGLTAAVPVAAGDCVVATIDRLGSLELACE